MTTDERYMKKRIEEITAERDRLRAALMAIRVTAREQTVKPGAPVEHALDFAVALDRILGDAAEALDNMGATT